MILCPDDELIMIHVEMHIHAGLDAEGLILSTFNQKQNVLTDFTQTSEC